MQCRRCFSYRLVQLDKKRPQDHYVFRCQECGFIFSPGGLPLGGGPAPDVAPGSRPAPSGSARPESRQQAQG